MYICCPNKNNKNDQDFIVPAFLCFKRVASFATRAVSSFTCAQRMLRVQRGVGPLPQHVWYLSRPVRICQSQTSEAADEMRGCSEPLYYAGGECLSFQVLLGHQG